jgi:hypothetical protein
MNALHHAANLLARSEVESLRTAHRESIRDTAYRVPGPAGTELLVVREVFDSADIARSLEELTLDDKLTPLEWRKPPEVRVRILMPEADEAGGTGWGGDFGASAGDWGGDSGPAGRTLSSLLVKLPEYRWY